MSPKEVFKVMQTTMQVWNGGGFGRAYWDSPRGKALFARIKAELEKDAPPAETPNV